MKALKDTTTHFQHLIDIAHETEDRAERGTMLDRAQLATHVRFWRVPSGQAFGMKKLIEGLALYADAHNAKYGSPIGEDDVLGGAWADATHAVRGLLNDELGGLDGGTLDKMLFGMLRREGFEK